MKQDEIKIEIMPDGTIKTFTDKVGQANHSNAEGFLTEMARLSGGTSSIKKKHSHGHTHSHTHEHEGH